MHAQIITSHDREILRSLARKQLEVAHSPDNLALIGQWLRHNACAGERPLIQVEVNTFEDEVITPLLRCEGESARQIERDLIRAFINRDTFLDDRVTPDRFFVRPRARFELFGHNVKRTPIPDAMGRQIGYQFHHIATDLVNNWDALVQPSRFSVDIATTNATKAQVEDIFGDILPVELSIGTLGASLTQEVVKMIGMEAMFFAMCDYPDTFLAFMDAIAQDYLAFFAYLEAQGYVIPAVGAENLTQGSQSFTDELPSASPAKCRDVWGYLDSQETVGVSPDMFRELIFPAYAKIGTMFGLLSYGCCEPVHAYWDCLSTFNNLRKISISPWCDEAFMADALKGRRVIFHRKPSPNYLGVGANLDEDGLREHISTTLRLTRGQPLEFSQRDVYTVNGDVGKVRRYVDIIRECISNIW